MLQHGQRVENHNAIALAALHAEPVAVPVIVAQVVQPLAAHGRRLMDQMRVEHAVISAARPASAAASRVSIVASDS